MQPCICSNIHPRSFVAMSKYLFLTLNLNRNPNQVSGGFIQKFKRPPYAT